MSTISVTGDSMLPTLRGPVNTQALSGAIRSEQWLHSFDVFFLIPEGVQSMAVLPACPRIATTLDYHERTMFSYPANDDLDGPLLKILLVHVR